MIFTIALYLISYIFTIVSVILPSWQLWPAVLLDGITYLTGAVMSMNFLFPLADNYGWISAFLFLINFEVMYLTAKIGVKIFNYVRGVGKGLDL